MKQKEKWALMEMAGNLTALDLDDREVRSWLAGFDFAKEKCADSVCDCCQNPQTCRDLGEDDQEDRIAQQIKDGIRDENGIIIPVPPIDFGSGEK